MDSNCIKGDEQLEDGFGVYHPIKIVETLRPQGIALAPA